MADVNQGLVEEQHLEADVSFGNSLFAPFFHTSNRHNADVDAEPLSFSMADIHNRSSTAIRPLAATRGSFVVLNVLLSQN